MNEKQYDDVIAPALRTIGAQCEAAGMSMVATVEYDPGKTASTVTLPKGACLAISMQWLCAQAGENIDAFIFAVARHCRDRGIDTDSSIVMQRLSCKELDGFADPQPKHPQAITTSDLANREAMMLHAADLLDNKAEEIYQSETLGDGAWGDDADSQIAKSEYDEICDAAARLREQCTGTPRPGNPHEA